MKCHSIHHTSHITHHTSHIVRHRTILMEVEDYERSSAAALRLQQWFRHDFQRLLLRRRSGQRIAARCRQMLMVYVSSCLEPQTPYVCCINSVSCSYRAARRLLLPFIRRAVVGSQVIRFFSLTTSAERLQRHWHAHVTRGVLKRRRTEKRRAAAAAAQERKEE